ncbi:MAG: hypothetical protein AAFQ59_15680 [Pseudomonadota bacterium]
MMPRARRECTIYPQCGGTSADHGGASPAFPHGDAFDVVKVSYRVLITDGHLVSFVTAPDDWRRCCFEQGDRQMRTATAPQIALRCAAYGEKM